MDNSNKIKLKRQNLGLITLRYSMLMFLSVRMTDTQHPSCSEEGIFMDQVGGLLSLLMIMLSLMTLSLLQYDQRVSEIQYKVCVTICLSFGLGILILRASTKLQKDQCMQAIIIEKWMTLSSVKLFVESILITCFSEQAIQKYINCPGNLVWSYIFMTIKWNLVPEVSNLFLAIGLIYTILSFFTLVINYTAMLLTNIPEIYKLILKYWWIGSILTMVALEIVCIVFYPGYENEHEDYYRIGANIMLLKFKVGNIIDLIFWFWGYLNFSYDYQVKDINAEQIQIPNIIKVE